MAAQRPIDPRYRISDSDNMVPDIIIQGKNINGVENVIYLLWYWHKGNQERDIYKIMRISESEVLGLGRIVTKKFPFGCSGYNFSLYDLENHENGVVDLSFEFEY